MDRQSPSNLEAKALALSKTFSRLLLFLLLSLEQKEEACERLEEVELKIFDMSGDMACLSSDLKSALVSLFFVESFDFWSSVPVEKLLSNCGELSSSFEEGSPAYTKFYLC